MVRSMTGFAAVTRDSAGDKVSVTLKSVNHRFLDIQIKAPQALASLEHRIRAALQQRLTRGRVEVTIFLERTAAPARDVILDEQLLDRLSQVIEAARAKGAIEGKLSVSDLLRVPQILEVRAKTDPAGTIPEALAQLVEDALGSAIDALMIMRETEGRFLESDLSAKLDAIGHLVDTLERLAREGQSMLGDRLKERLAALPSDTTGDPALLAQEVVRFVARSDVDEEVVRMRGHINHWRALVGDNEACGRKLDFLLQEMNREINTIGSKAEGSHATEAVIAAKTELERLREQVQNVE